ncbi:PepSY domain-containing protein [bacterium]|nr:PepSY domain-containing protein [bacterium]
MTSAARTFLQHRVWRWHFFAGLMVIPFVVILAISGAVYLFNPQAEAIIERQIHARGPSDVPGDVPAGVPVPADRLVEIALAAHPDAALKRFILPRGPGDLTAEVELGRPGGDRYLWIDTRTGDILHDVASADRLMTFVKRIHGTLLAGDRGSLVVEIMASWTIILVVTGLFLWWPRGGPWWRVFAPDFKAAAGRREVWRKLHGATGAWIGVVVLVFLLSGLPWTQVWGDGYARVKQVVGLKSPGQEWFVTLQSGAPPPADAHAGHEMGGADLWSSGSPAEAPPPPLSASTFTLQDVIDVVGPQGLAPPVQVQPPRGEAGVWTVRAMSPNRPLQETVHYDRWSGDEIMRIRFSDHNVADRVVAYGVAFHEGALFGWLNQAVGLIAAAGVVALSVTGGVMWWRRRPRGRVGVPPMPADRRIAGGVVAVILALGVFLPMAGITLVLAICLDLLWSRVRPRRTATG